MIIEGRLIRCDRCKTEIFEKRLEDESKDGGFTKLPRFENSHGWEHVSELGDLCSDCAQEWRALKYDFMTEYPEEGSNENN